ncbi:MAG: RNA polymerase sigma factor [Caldilineaceae bacterium]|nr:RNA polymerase sigma factor [Caldilineaceae bacterium]
MKHEALVEATTTDEPAVWVEELYAAYATAVSVYIHSLVHDWALAHDCTQETFLQLYQTRTRLQGVANRRAWLYRIASHVALNTLKRRRRFAWLPWTPAVDRLHGGGNDPAAAMDSRDAVAAALAAVPEHYRAPLLLYTVYGFSTREIAEMLTVSVDTVKQRLHRAREQFRQAYAQAHDEP